MWLLTWFGSGHGASMRSQNRPVRRITMPGEGLV